MDPMEPFTKKQYERLKSVLEDEYRNVDGPWSLHLEPHLVGIVFICAILGAVFALYCLPNDWGQFRAWLGVLLGGGFGISSAVSLVRAIQRGIRRHISAISYVLLHKELD